MAKGVDDLVNHVLSEIALTGVQGMHDSRVSFASSLLLFLFYFLFLLFLSTFFLLYFSTLSFLLFLFFFFFLLPRLAFAPIDSAITSLFESHSARSRLAHLAQPPIDQP